MLRPRVQESSTKKRLADVRAFIYRNLHILEDPSRWPVKLTVLELALQEAVELASQEAGMVLGDKHADTTRQPEHLASSI